MAAAVWQAVRVPRWLPGVLAGLFVGFLAAPAVPAPPAEAATIYVTSTDDTVSQGDSKVTLREAIAAINAGNDLGDSDIATQNPGTFGTADTIGFSIGGAGVLTINVTGAGLPTITKTVTINGYSQPGAGINNV